LKRAKQDSIEMARGLLLDYYHGIKDEMKNFGVKDEL